MKEKQFLVKMIAGNVENTFSTSFLRLSIDLLLSTQLIVIDDIVVRPFLEDFLLINKMSNYC